MGCAASQQTTSVAPRAVTHLTVVDLRLLTVLRSGAIKLLDASFLRDGSDEFIRRRQDLEQLERETGTRVYIPPEMAATLLTTGARVVASLTYGWCSPNNPDPSGAYLGAVRRFLRHPLGAHIKAVFWDFASLPQKPRTPAEDDAFSEALKAMGDMYASALGVTVIRHQSIPPRPSEYIGKLVLLPPQGLEPTSATDGAAIVARFGLDAHGRVDVNVGAEDSSWLVTYETQEQADAAVGALAVPLEAEGGAIFTLWNNRPYSERGWTTFESAVSTEVVARAYYYPKTRRVLERLPPKLIDIDHDVQVEPVAVPEAEIMAGGEKGGAKARIDRVREALCTAVFTGKGDRDKVVNMFNTYVDKMIDALQARGEGTTSGVYEDEYAMGGNALAPHPVYHGRGTYWFSSGDVYEGEWRGGKRDGRGTQRQTDGSTFYGEWKKGQLEGRYVVHLADGRVKVGIREAGKDFGQGVGWRGAADQALRFQDGHAVEEISREEALQMAARLLGEAVDSWQEATSKSHHLALAA